MSDHYHGMMDLRRSMDILHTMREILRVATSYRPEKERELLSLAIEVNNEVNVQRDLLLKLEQHGTLGRTYHEERGEIRRAYEEVVTIQREIANISYEQKMRSMNAILSLLQNNRDHIANLLPTREEDLELPG